MRITIRKTLELIETYTMARSFENEEMQNIYMWAHTALNPDCRKNHDRWTKDLMKELRRMK